METFFRVTGPLCWEFTTGELPSQKPMTRSFDVFCAWINGWINNRDAGDLRCHYTHYDVTVMYSADVERHICNLFVSVCLLMGEPWWRHQMETFSALLALCEGNSPVTSEFPSQRPVMRSFDVFFDLCLSKQLSKQSRRWWFQTPLRPLWRQRNGIIGC